jgi:hypothetical protein
MAGRGHRDNATQRPDEGAGGPGERDTPGADAFVDIRESHVPWDDDAPVIREDEHYERINETGGDWLSPVDRALLDEFDG